MKKIDFIYFDAGGGHRSAAMALKSVIDSQNRATGGEPWEVRLVNLQEVLDSLDIFRKITGLRLEDVYNKMLAKGWTLGSAQGLQFMHGVIRLYHEPTVRLLTAHWKDTQPDLVVSLVPNFNRALYQSLRTALPKVPYVTILTDFADYPPHFWMEAGQDQYFICGTEKAVQQARSLGHTDDRIYSASGMILRPRFYEPVNVNREREARTSGSGPVAPHRAGAVRRAGLEGHAGDLPSGCAIPNSSSSAGATQNWPSGSKPCRAKAPRFIEGFTQEVPYYMAAFRFLHRQARAGQHQRSGGDEAAGDRRAQRLDAAAGAL